MVIIDIPLHLAVEFPGLRRNGSSSQIINQAQDFLEQASRHGNFGQLDPYIAAMASDLGSDLYQLLPQYGRRPVLHFLRQGEILLMAIPGLNHRTGTTTAFIREADIRVRFALSAHQISN